MKIFISHSSSDKKRYVNKLVEFIVNSVGKDSVIYDELTFENGEKNIDEIYRNIEVTNLYVILLSREALERKYVRKELKLAKGYLEAEKLNRIYPIIIEKNLTYKDENIPKWLKQYNLKPILDIRKAANLIIERAMDLNWKLHVESMERENIFVGRNELLNKFEIRFDDFSKVHMNTLIMCGLPDIGRKSLARQCLIKTSIISATYQFPKITLTRRESIEDFILKIDDLGFDTNAGFEKISKLSMQEKKSMAIEISKKIADLCELVTICDEGCLIDYRGNIVDWFAEVMKHSSLADKIIYVISSRYKINYESFRNIPSAFFLSVPELSLNERKGLLNRLSMVEHLDLSYQQMEEILPHLKGYPGQIQYAIDLIKHNGFSYLKNNLKKLMDYGQQRVSLLLELYAGDQRVQEILALVSKNDAISINMLQRILKTTKGYMDVYNQMLNDSLFELEGINGEYIRVNSVIKDYILRTMPKICPAHRLELEKIFKEMFSDNNSSWYNVNDFLFGIRNAVHQGKKIPEKFIIPSVYLKVMSDLYSEMRYNDVLALARRAMEQIDNMDEKIIYEIRHRMCLALAKLKKSECLSEANQLNSEDKGFIHAFFYRQTGKNDKALEKLNELLDKRSEFSQAKREKVLVLTRLQQYDKALELAKENYLFSQDNPYHIQAYFDCLINLGTDKDKSEYDKTLSELLEKLERIKSEKARSMYSRCHALYTAYVEEDEENAYEELEMSKNMFPIDRVYVLIVKFNIALHYFNIDIMKNVIEELKEGTTSKNEIILCESKYMALKDVIGAINHFSKKIRFFTEESKKVFCTRLNIIYENFQRYKENEL